MPPYARKHREIVTSADMRKTKHGYAIKGSEFEAALLEARRGDFEVRKRRR